MYRFPTDTTTGTGHTIGKTYLSTYWRKRYVVLGHGYRHPADERMSGVTVVWEDRTNEAVRHNTLRGTDPEAEPFAHDFAISS